MTIPQPDAVEEARTTLEAAAQIWIPAENETARRLCRMAAHALIASSQAEPSRRAPPAGETAELITTLSKRLYSLNEPHLNGFRLILGFRTMAEVQAAQIAVALLERAPQDAE